MKDPFLDIVNIPLVLIGETGLIQDANKAFCDLLFIARDAISGRSFNKIDCLKPIEKSINSAIMSGKPAVQRLGIDERSFEVSMFPFRKDDKYFITLCLYEITPFLEIEEQLRRRNRELMIINTLSGAFISSENTDEIFNELLEKVLLITDFTTGWIMLNGDKGFKLINHQGMSKLLIKEISEGKISEFCNNIAASNDPLYIFEEDELRKLPVINKEGLAILAAVPVKTGNKLKGIVFLASRGHRTFDFNLASILSLISGQLTLIVDKVELFEEARRLAITDSLTELFNSRYFYEALDKEIARAQRYNLVFSLAILDIDDFKTLNDTYGHQAGDEILRALARILKRESREPDIVARYGGEEFVIIFPNTPKEDALAVAKRILNGIERHTFLEDQGLNVRVTISAGIASYPGDSTIGKDLLYYSDMAMYMAKHSGKNQVVCYNKSYEKNIQET
ncbi:response regulator PleD [bacterium BMS3Abin07]|nr:response regulator PleD [bacterium BMS3Abin07]GBE31243.1 response regulator PleD [bacterium BMS3Bbin05]HDL20169.1 diguanylate cyclase [Nitrospirota bacterium]HDO21675.1 diguanylate cyclase [Nitrospirota bacterium]HDZ87857.1 diguanylate cyclase [Nitrospirota bacterium]